MMVSDVYISRRIIASEQPRPVSMKTSINVLGISSARTDIEYNAHPV